MMTIMVRLAQGVSYGINIQDVVLDARHGQPPCLERRSPVYTSRCYGLTEPIGISADSTWWVA